MRSVSSTGRERIVRSPKPRWRNCVGSRKSAFVSRPVSPLFRPIADGSLRNIFYRIYDNGNQSNPDNGILELLDFHPLSITLLATVARRNKWDVSQLTRELERLGTSIPQTECDENLVAAIELLLTSPRSRNSALTRNP